MLSVDCAVSSVMLIDRVIYVLHTLYFKGNECMMLICTYNCFALKNHISKKYGNSLLKSQWNRLKMYK